MIPGGASLGMFLLSEAMQARDFRKVREQLGLSVAQVAAYLRVQGRTVRRYESGERQISGPVAKLMERLAAGSENV